MFRRLLPFLFASFGTASAQDLVMVAPLNQIMPLVQFQNDKLTGGILKDLGDALGQRLGRRVNYVSVPGPDVSGVLTQGKADGICYVRPIWIDGDFDWTKPVIADSELVAAIPSATPIRSLLDLRDRPVGTVTSYRYPRVEQVLGLRFQRIDSPTMDENLRKVVSGQIRYTVISQVIMSYQQRVNRDVRLRRDLVFATFNAQCAFSKRSNVPFAEVNSAINAMLEDGTVEDILRRYR